MGLEQKFKMLQMIYAGALTDFVLRMGKEGILEKVTLEKREEQMLNGKIRAAQFGIEKPEGVFWCCQTYSVVQTGRLKEMMKA